MDRDWRQTAELMGIAAIIVSLILLVYEIRQNTLSVQSTALQQHFDQHTSLMLARLDNPELRAVTSKAFDGLSSLTVEELGLYGPYITNVMRNHFVAFELMQSGILPENQWLTFRESLRRGLERSTGEREFWKERRYEYTPEFQDLIDNLVTQIDDSSL